MNVELLDWLGTDLTVTDSARVSFSKRSYPAGNTVKKVVVDGETLNINVPEIDNRDKRLLNYLARHGHWTPFAHPQISFRITAPVFVRSQLFKHKSGLVENEASRRYISDDPEFWYPKSWREKPQNAKQGSGEGFSLMKNVELTKEYKYAVEVCEEVYKRMLERNVAPEQARAVLPQAMYTSWIWSGSLYAFSRVCRLRLDSHAQQETGEIAQMISDYCEILFPESWKALDV